MSGHSKWATIKRKKELKDAKRGKKFSILVKDITIAARNGRDQEMNPNLKMAISKAKKENLPQVNIQKAIDRGASIKEGKAFELIYGALGSNGEIILLEVITENRNRTLHEVKEALDKINFKFAEGDSVMWNFDKLAYIVLDGKISEDEELELMEKNIIDIKYSDNSNETKIILKISELEDLKRNYKSEKIKESGVGYFPKNKLNFDVKKTQEIESILNDLDDVESIWGNWID